MSKKSLQKQIEKYVYPKLEGKTPVFCLTGQMAAGKNYICSLMEEMGFVSIDLDKEAHKVIDEKAQVIFDTFEETAKKSGINIRNNDNTVNRGALGSLLFTDSELLEKHENILYPAMVENVKNFIKAHKGKKEVKGIILNATVLYKTPELLKKCDFVTYIHANWIKRFNRARKRDSISEIQILQRFSSQKNLLDYYRKSGKEIVVIKN